MNIRDAIILLSRYETKHNAGAYLRNRNRAPDWTLYIAAGSVFRLAETDDQPGGQEVTLDARDCRSDAWYVVDEDGKEIASP